MPTSLRLHFGQRYEGRVWGVGVCSSHRDRNFGTGGVKNETLLSDSRTHLVREWEGSSYHTPGPLVPRGSSTRYSSVGETYLYSAVDSLVPRLSQVSTVRLGGHSFPIDPLAIGELMIFSIPTPPTINLRATYSSYPPSLLPPREKTNRP